MHQSSGLAEIGRVFRNRNYAINQAGQIPHWISMWMLNVGIGWVAWELTHSPAWLGILAAAEFAPALLLAPFAGANADRVEPIRQIRWAQALQLVQAIALAAVVVTGNVGIELLVGLVLVGGTITAFVSTARFGIVPGLVDRQDLPRAIAVESALFHTSRFLGPALAAVAIPLFGVESIFVASVVGNASFLITLHIIRPTLREPRSTAKGPLLADMVEGFRYVRGHSGIFPIFAVLLVISVCGRPLQDMLPAFAGSVFHTGATGLALLTSALGVGSMLSASLVAVRASVSSAAILVACGGLGLSMAGFLVSDHLVVGILFATCVGFAINSISTRTQALVQSTVEDQLRGRVMSVYIVLFRGTPAIGALALGALAEIIGLRISFALAAVLCVVTAAALYPRRHAIEAGLRSRSAAEGPRGD